MRKLKTWENLIWGFHFPKVRHNTFQGCRRFQPFIILQAHIMTFLNSLFISFLQNFLQIQTFSQVELQPLRAIQWVIEVFPQIDTHLSEYFNLNNCLILAKTGYHMRMVQLIDHEEAAEAWCPQVKDWNGFTDGQLLWCIPPGHYHEVKGCTNEKRHKTAKTVERYL